METILTQGFHVDADALMVEVDGWRWIFFGVRDLPGRNYSVEPLEVRLSTVSRTSTPDRDGVLRWQVGRIDVRRVDKFGRGTWYYMGSGVMMERLDENRAAFCLRQGWTLNENRKADCGCPQEVTIDGRVVRAGSLTTMPDTERMLTDDEAHPASVLHSTTFTFDSLAPEAWTRLVTLSAALQEPPVAVRAVAVRAVALNAKPESGRRVTVMEADGATETVESLRAFVERYDLDLERSTPQTLYALARIFDVPWTPTHRLTLRRGAEERVFVVFVPRAHAEVDGPGAVWTLGEWLANVRCPRWQVSASQMANQPSAWRLHGNAPEHYGWTLDVEALWNL